MCQEKLSKKKTKKTIGLCGVVTTAFENMSLHEK